MTGLLERMLRRFRGRAVLDHPALLRNRELCAGLDQDRPLSECSFVVLDTELSSMDPRKGEIVSIGAVRLKGLELVPSDRFRTLVRPRNTAPTDSTLIHRITPEDLAHAPALEEVLPDFARWCGGDVLVGHYIDLDMGFLNRACQRLLGAALANPCIDTLRMAQCYEERRPDAYLGAHLETLSYTLSALSVRYGLPDFPRHDALGDALQTAYLFLFLAKKIQSGRIRTLRELWRAQKSRAGLS